MSERTNELDDREKWEKAAPPGKMTEAKKETEKNEGRREIERNRTSEGKKQQQQNDNERGTNVVHSVLCSVNGVVMGRCATRRMDHGNSYSKGW